LRRKDNEELIMKNGSFGVITEKANEKE